MKVFVIHYKKLNDRKTFMIEQFKKYNIYDYEFIEIDRDELLKNQIEMFQINFPNRQIAVSLSHFYAFKQIAEKYEEALIFEDDAVLTENFSNIFNNYYKELPKNYDMLFIGNGCNLHIPSVNILPNVNIYKKCIESTSWGGDGITRCTDSYLVSKKCAIKICSYIDNLKYKINQPIDWWLNRVGRDIKLDVYWSEPTIVSQGTQNGLFNSSLR